MGPAQFFLPYDAKAVTRKNIVDTGCLAHRAGLADARFDERLTEGGDWDIFLRLTRDKPPLALPAIACFYSTDAPNRLSNGPTHERDLALILISSQNSAYMVSSEAWEQRRMLGSWIWRRKSSFVCWRSRQFAAA